MELDRKSTIKIRLLSELTINQIAAGEVIENPASVVKELVENSLDAGAHQITIEILGGGFQLVRICDNGSGMTPEEAILSLQRHATSKIVDPEDLFALTTMGFRGEALASIAAISKLRLITSCHGREAADIEVEGGRVIRESVGARLCGTTVEVRSLFYNVPARKKFQKSPAASSAEITKVVTQLCLGYPEVGFTLIAQDKVQFSLAPSDLKKRAEEVLQDQWLGSSHPFLLQEENYTGHGLIADPLFSRHNRSGQHLFVNRRAVYCAALNFAVKDGYGTRLSPDRHPLYIVHVRISPHLIDVNVHPQKKEVRLREEERLKQLVRSSVNVALGGVRYSEPVLPTPIYTDFSPSFVFREEREEVPVLEVQHKVEVIGVYGCYALFSAKQIPFFACDGLVWLDIRAAEARIHFDHLINQKETENSSQAVLVPLCYSCSKAESQLLELHLIDLARLGIHMHKAAENAFLIDAIPPFLEEKQIIHLLEEMIEELTVTRDVSLGRLATLMSRRSRRQGYSVDVARLILAQLLNTSDPLHSPQGKKTLHLIQEEEIEKYFS